jgi:hypothetical protein
MKRLTVILMALALVLAGATCVLAKGVPQAQPRINQALPQALQGVNLTSAQVVTPDQARIIRGAAPPPQLSGLNTAYLTIRYLNPSNSDVLSSMITKGLYNGCLPFDIPTWTVPPTVVP